MFEFEESIVDDDRSYELFINREVVQAVMKLITVLNNKSESLIHLAVATC